MTVIIKGIEDPQFGERALAIHPAISPGADAAERDAQAWRRRSRYFSGRSVTDRALNADQRHVQGALVTSAQRLASGVVAGLEAHVEGERLEPRLHIAPGIGLTVTGEDVRVPLPLEIDARALIVDDGVAELRSLGEHLDADPTDARIYVLQLRPAVLHRVGESDPNDPCEVDPAELAFQDEQLVDGCRVRLRPLPESLWPAPTTPPRWRNALAHAVFEAEAALPRGTHFPFEHGGLAIGLLGFPQGDAPAFLDIHTVARMGGHASGRHGSWGAPGTSRLWQARFEQFLTQLRETDMNGLIAAGLDTQFRWLPPVGMLPPGSVDLRGDRGEPDYPLPHPTILPADFVLEAVPVELEGLDEYLHAGAFQAPLDLLAQEQIQVLVPIPQQHFDPDLLIVEDETPDEFRETIELFLLRLNHRLGRRFSVRIYARHLADHLFGEPTSHALDPDAVAGEIDAYFPVDAILEARGELLPPPESTAAEITRERLLKLVATMSDAVGVLDDGDSKNPLAALLNAIMVENGRPEPDLLGDTLPHSQLPHNYVGRRFGGAGLVGFGNALARRLVLAAERIEVAFTRVQAELHGLRAYMVGEDAAHQLLSSPVVAAIARRSIEPASAPTLSTFKRFILSQEASLVVDPNDSDTLNVVTAGIPTGGKQISSSILFGQDLMARLQRPVALDSAETARRAKIAALQSLLFIHSELGLSLHGLDFPVLRRPHITPPLVQDEAITIDHIATAIDQWLHLNEWPHDDIEAGSAETVFFAQSVRSLEELVAALRIGEARLTAYEAVLDLTRAEVDTLRAIHSSTTQRLAQLQDEISELRHDVRVARALEREDVARAIRLNTRRRQVIDEHVPFLVFRRPRTTDATRSVPSVQLQPGRASAAVPECLAAEFEAPEQLRVMIDLVREMPLRWLVVGPELAARINRWPALRQLAEVAWHRANNPEPFDYDAFDGPAFTDRVGARLRGLYHAQRDAFVALRLSAGAWLGTQAHMQFAWHRLLQTVQRNATVNDLLLSPHGRQDVMRDMSEVLTDLYRVAACIYVRLRAVPPIVRLGWVELVSEEDDDPIDLDDLSILPAWESVDRVDRRELQTLVDWLFDQFSTEHDGARDFVQDLVRVALLSSAHAPVQQVLDAQIVNPRPVTRGGRIDLRLDHRRVRVGMHVLLYADASRSRAVGHGIIDDLAQGLASVRVIETELDRAVSPARALVSEPSAGPRVILGDGSAVQIGVASRFSRSEG